MCEMHDFINYRSASVSAVADGVIFRNVLLLGIQEIVCCIIYDRNSGSRSNTKDTQTATATNSTNGTHKNSGISNLGSRFRVARVNINVSGRSNVADYVVR